LTAQDVVSNLSARNATLSTFQAHVDIRLHTGIPFLNPTFEGMTYFKQPDRHEVIFTKSPSYAKGFEQLYSDVSDPTVWDKKFICTIDGDQEYNGTKDIALRLVERVRGSLDHETVLVDPRHWVIDEIVYSYYSGGHITVDKVYSYEGGFAQCHRSRTRAPMRTTRNTRSTSRSTIRFSRKKPRNASASIRPRGNAWSYGRV
jgi:hypothetical protein